jgi:hypothetical protein
MFFSTYSCDIPHSEKQLKEHQFLRKVQILRPFSAKSPKPETFRGPSTSCRGCVPFFPEKSKTWLFKLQYSTLSCPVVFAHFSSTWAGLVSLVPKFFFRHVHHTPLGSVGPVVNEGHTVASSDSKLSIHVVICRRETFEETRRTIIVFADSDPHRQIRIC